MNAKTLRDIESTLIDFVERELVEDEMAGIEAGTPLLQLGVLNSLNVVRLLDHVQTTFGVMIPPEAIVADNFGCISSIARLVSSCDSTSEPS